MTLGLTKAEAGARACFGVIAEVYGGVADHLRFLIDQQGGVSKDQLRTYLAAIDKSLEQAKAIARGEEVKG